MGARRWSAIAGVVVLGAAALFLPSRPGARVARAAEAPAGAGLVHVDDEPRRLALDLPAGVLLDLRTADWSGAWEGLKAVDPNQLVAPRRADLLFVRAWVGVRSGHAAEVAGTLSQIDAAPTPPAAYKALVRAEVLRASDDALGALAALDGVPADAAIADRAAAARAELLHGLGRTAEAAEVYETLVRRPDPTPGNAFALLSLAKRRGVGSDAAYPLLRRLWSWYPGTEEATAAGRLLADAYPDRAATIEEAARRAVRKVDLGSYADALTLTAPHVARSGDGTLGGCLVAYARVRAYFKQNELTASAESLGDAGRRCAGVAGGEGARTLYVAGQALFRKKDYAGAAGVFALIPELYPSESVADDGLLHAGLARFELGDVEGAAALWTRALDAFPAGDTVPESTFRLAFARYDQGRPDEARRFAARLAALPPGADETHVAAGAYWAARWLAYPDARAPDRLTDDPAALAAAIDAWAGIVEHHPWGWYGALAWSRLVELAPDRAKALDVSAARDADGWDVPEAALADGGFARGVALARLGLLREALAEWDRADVDTFTGAQMAWATELRVACGDWLAAHDRMHRWLHAHPLGTHGGDEPEIVRVAYPERYHDEVFRAAEGYSYPPRMLHALVREESMFNKDIVSFAGAKGLAQLMPATAATVAKALGLSRYDLSNPADNTRLGARYLDDVLDRQGGDPALALAAYNAGPGNVSKWLVSRGNLPLDEFVERIPFRETRGYVKRVTGTWQVMTHALPGDGRGFVDLSRFNHRARPDLPASTAAAAATTPAAP